MTWYYVDAGQQAGPVDDTQLETLVHEGKIRPQTLVWREGMANWQPYGEVSPASLQANPPGVTEPAGLPPVAHHGVCAECGKVFELQDMITYRGLRVCAACKPILLQKLAEGAQLRVGLNYAGFWLRFGAVFLDWLLLWVVNMTLNVLAGVGFRQSLGLQPLELSVGYVVLLIVQTGIALTYEVVLIGKYGATLGKMACKIKVVAADGSRISYLRALGRYFAKMLSALVCAIGYLIAAFDDEKRALHDHLCNTRVVTQ